MTKTLRGGPRDGAVMTWSKELEATGLLIPTAPDGSEDPKWPGLISFYKHVDGELVYQGSGG